MITLHVFFTLILFVPGWYLMSWALDRVTHENQTAHTILNIILISGFVVGTESFLGSSF